MNTENKDPQNKNSIGAFSVSSDGEDRSTQGEGGMKTLAEESTSLDSRLEKLSPTTSPSVVIGSATPEDVMRGVEYADTPLEVVETSAESSPLGRNSQNENISSYQGTGTYYTISGGPETLGESKQKNASTVIEKQAFSTIGIPTKKEEVVVEESSLFVLFCKVAVFCLAAFLGLAFSLPHLLPFLIENGYLVLVREGVYSTGSITFTNTISGQIPYLTSLLVVGSFVVLFISFLVDLMVGKSIFLFAKVFIFIIIALVLGVSVFYLQIGGTDILGMVNRQLEVFK